MRDEDLIQDLRDYVARRATLMELVDRLHEVQGCPKYTRGLVLNWFSKAFDLRPRDFHIIFACALFGDGATVSAEETERRFRPRLLELADRAPDVASKSEQKE